MPVPSGVLIKPVSGLCNLSCQYCFYRHQKGEAGERSWAMSDEVLDKFIREYLECSKTAGFAWQGGEPTLAGIDFYKRVLEKQSKYSKPGQIIANSLQTNGTLLTPEFAKFLASNDFLIGVSVDGQRKDHDRYRRDHSGLPSFDRVLGGLSFLRDEKAEVNILTVLTPENASNSWKLYTSLKKHRVDYLQFIPLMESPEDAKGDSLTLEPNMYGKFLCETFDYWYSDLSTDRPISIRTFDNAVGLAAGVPSELCTFQRGCRTQMVLETDGSIYPCDFFVLPEWRLGNVLEQHLSDIMNGPLVDKFRMQSLEIPDECRRCRWISFCNGGCMAERLFAKNKGTLSYYCESYKMFFDYACSRLTYLAGRLIRN